MWPDWLYLKVGGKSVKAGRMMKIRFLFFQGPTLPDFTKSRSHANSVHIGTESSQRNYFLLPLLIIPPNLLQLHHNDQHSNH